MPALNAKAQAIVSRLAEINYDEPYWNELSIVEAFKRQYETLGLSLPKVSIAPSLTEGFRLAWDAARDAARGAAWDAAWDAARGAARDAAWGAARDAAWGAARGAAWDAARGAAWDAARGAAWGAARGAAWDAARDAARGAAAVNTGLTDAATARWIEIAEQELIALENGLGWFFPMRDALILVPTPRMILNGDRLHYDHGKAIEWKDRSGFYFLRGVQLDQDLYEKVVSYRLTPEEVLTIPNADQRMAAISMLRPDRLLTQLGASLLAEGVKGTRLYEVKDFMGTGRTEYCMWMKDASTDREFIEWVEPSLGKQGNPDACQAAAFGIPLEDYLLMEQEA